MTIRTLGLIPARQGSKRVPGKNTKLLAGRPLITWTIKAALGSPWLDEIAVSADGEDSLTLAGEHGIKAIRRPPLLSHDTSLIYGAIIHALSLISAEYVVLLQPTSPLRLTEDIDGCIIACGTEKACVSVEEGKDYPNGAIYVGRSDWLRAGGNFDTPGLLRYYMPSERSLDINTPEDFSEAERLMR